MGYNLGTLTKCRFLHCSLDHFEKIFLLDYWRYYHGDIQQQKLLIDIIETKPANAISIIETDCEVDFTPPLDYKELKKPTTASKTLEKGFNSCSYLVLFVYYLSHFPWGCINSMEIWLDF